MWPSSRVRDTFIQYFVKHRKFPHTKVPSSSIIPRNDPTLAFVNAGMNQFKDSILGLGRPPDSRVTNSQKCLRINDLSLVGTDTYHHTFFEMMGNWSFADYFKAEACEMAFDLLVNHYCLNPDRLYVTYFAGESGIPTDTETKKIWESIGVPRSRILPFKSENFWSMGPVGPCGPSTEIHYDHRGTATNCEEVNGVSGNVVEIWNLVFMQYNKTSNGTLEKLPLSHVVDTGAGLERLCAVLNNKLSNYDTDLFYPIFDVTQEVLNLPQYSGNFCSEDKLIYSRDTSYRVFSDHVRAITIALSDGILPQTNHKIRKLIHRTLDVVHEMCTMAKCNPDSSMPTLLDKSVHCVERSLSPSYPELGQMRNEVHEILQYEIQQYFENLKNTEISKHPIIPALLLSDYPALKRIKINDLREVQQMNYLSGTKAYKWYDSLGVTEEASEELCNALNLKFDKLVMQHEMSKAKQHFRKLSFNKLIHGSNDVFIKNIESHLYKLNPDVSGGICNPGMSTSEEQVIVEWIFNDKGDILVDSGDASDKVWIILNKTPFIPGGKTMISDAGVLVLNDMHTIEIQEVLRLPSGWILHSADASNLPQGFCTGVEISDFEFDNVRLFGRELSAQCIYHTQTWLYKKFRIVRFLDGFVSADFFILEYTIFKNAFGLNEVQLLQEHLIKQAAPVVITNLLSKDNGTYELQAVVGTAAEAALRHGSEATALLKLLESLISSTNYSSENFENVKVHSDELKRCLQSKMIHFPIKVNESMKSVVADATKFLVKSQESVEIQNLIEVASQSLDNRDFSVLCYDTDHEFNTLRKAFKVATENSKPLMILVISKSGFVQGRCFVPQMLQCRLGADEWMNAVLKKLEVGSASAPKGQNPKEVVNLKRVKIRDNFDSKINSATEEAKNIASRSFSTSMQAHEDIS